MSQFRVKAKNGPAMLITDDKEHNHIRKLMRMREEGLLDLAPGCQELRVVHDDWCAFFCRGERCDCDPSIEILPRRAGGEKSQ